MGNHYRLNSSLLIFVILNRKILGLGCSSIDAYNFMWMKIDINLQNMCVYYLLYGMY